MKSGSGEGAVGGAGRETEQEPDSAGRGGQVTSVGHDGDRHRPRARNVILLIGDGMGQAHRQAGQLFSVGRAGRLEMDQLPHAGTMGTLSADPDFFVTDSAAAATALATGVKTSNGAISIDLHGHPRTTILEHAKRAGKATGLVTTCQITDATPAAFAAHVPHRSDQSEVARQYLDETGVDVILGGGAAYWLPAGQPSLFPVPDGETREESQGNDGNLIDEARALGYDFVRTGRELTATTNRRVLGLFANQELFNQHEEGRGGAYDPDISLADMTENAIRLLSATDEGFFLLVEESAIDRMAHRNNAPLTIKGVLELDRAVQIALAHAERNPETLIIVTADHECGGLAIAGSDDPPYPYQLGSGLLDTVMAGEDGPFPIADVDHGFVMGWATTGHTGATVPVTAAGPGAEQLSGSYENTHLFTVMAEAMGLTPLAAAPRWTSNGAHGD